MGKYRFSILVYSLLIFLIVGCEDTSDLIQPEDVDQWVKIDQSDGLPSSTIWTVFEDSNNDIWIGTFDSGISRFDGSSYQSFDISDGLADVSILSITEYQGSMIVGTYDGWAYLDGNSWYATTAADVGAGDFVVYALLSDTQGRLWMSHAGYGLWVFDNGWSFYQDNSCINCNWVNDFFEDSNGVIWSATDGGLRKHTGPNSYTLYTSANGIHGDRPTHIYEDSRGNIWIGYKDSPFVTKYDGNSFEPVFLRNDNFIDFNIEITGIVEDRNKHMWFTTLGLGAISTDGLTYMPYFTDNSEIPSDITTEVIVDSKGDLWIATFSGIFKYISP